MSDEEKNEALTPEAVEKLVQSETDKIRTEYSRKLKEAEKTISDLEGERDGSREREINTISDLRTEAAEVKAMRTLVTKQGEMIAKALEHDIDPALAAKFAETSDADATFELAIAEIERRAETKTNERLTANVVTPKRGDERVDYTQLSAAEIARLPASQREAAFLAQVEKVI